MPRKRRPPFEAAVSASPLFKLALEVRIMIYELLLIQEPGMSIPSDIFARRDYGRTDSAPWQCQYCGLVFLSDYGCIQHIAKSHGRSASLPLQYQDPERLLLPQVSASLLQTCRIIRFEASPVLYLKNSFHFSDPVTASNFRWGTDCEQAEATQEIGIKFGSQRYKRVTQWATYFTKRTLSLGQDFPYLRRMTINIDFWVGVMSASLLRSMSEGFRERSQALDWVLVLALDDEEMLDYFELLVNRKDDSKDGNKEVRRHAWTNKAGVPWIDALLWWGAPGEAVPRKPRSIRDQLRLSQPTNEGGATQLTAPTF